MSVNRIPKGWRRLHRNEIICIGDKLAGDSRWIVAYDSIGYFAGTWPNLIYIRKIKTK